MNKTKIDWCTHTVNPVVGCTFGCEYCYARRLNNRFKWIEDWNKPQFFPERLKQLKSKKPKIIFMNSMSDIADWKEEWTQATFKAIEENTQHIYLFLSKRPTVYARVLSGRYLSQNIWFGATATHIKNYITNSTELYKTTGYDAWKNANRFLSIEPILERIPEYILCVLMDQLDWIIVGAETGNRKDKVIPKKEWIMDIKNQCNNAGVPIFMKESLRELMGQDFVQEFPW